MYPFPDRALIVASDSVRTDKELLVATKPFAIDQRFRSWWYLISTLLAYFACLSVCFLDLPWYIRLPLSCINGLLIVRIFIIYHDFQHHAILVHSRVAEVIMQVYGMLVLSPTSVWNRSHDHHHQHNCKENSGHIGSYPVMTCEQFAASSLWEKVSYIVSRHPLTIAFGYLTVFMGGMCLRAIFINPWRHLDAAIALLIHVGLIALLTWMGWGVLIYCMMLPLMIACGVGSYLFYAQHNFPGCVLEGREGWSYVGAALHSSSYIPMNPIMQWFTGNIGYHHIHHLNAKIPFYRLPETMASLSELQKPASTTLSIRDIVACFRLNLWDAKQERFVSYREARLSRLRTQPAS